MSDYGLIHADQVYTPNHTQGITPAENAERNQAIERAELARWADAPDRQLAYYAFPAEHLPTFGRPRPYRTDFRPCLHTYINAPNPGDPGIAHRATVTTWIGAELGVITAARVYQHNFGGRFVSIRVRGSNGAEYYGRASWDSGSVIRLRKVKG